LAAVAAAVLAVSLAVPAPAHAQAGLGGDKSSDRWAREDAEKKRITDELEKSARAASGRVPTQQQQAIDPWANMRGGEPAKPERKPR
jgi:hypothetical protein